MAETKTHPTKASVEAYLAARASVEQQADCHALMALCARITGAAACMWGPSIVGYGSYSYRYASGHSGRSCLVGFAVRGRDLVLYLLAEDDTSMREYLQRALQRVGYDVDAVGCGTEAVPLLAPGRYDLLLTDIVMPEMDGIELAQKASAVDPAIRVMFITGFAAVALQAGKTAPEAKLLSKPFHLKDLVAEVDRLFQTEDQHGRL